MPTFNVIVFKKKNAKFDTIQHFIAESKWKAPNIFFVIKNDESINKHSITA